MRRFSYLKLIIILVLLNGCQDYNFMEQAKKIKELQDKCSELELKVKLLELQKDRIADLSKRIMKLEINQFDEAFLDISSKGYQRIDTPSGFFLISLEDIKPYGNGYKLYLKVGNISTARYSGFKFKIKYGKQFDSKEWEKDIAAYEKWEKTLKLKELSFTNDLEPGIWNRIELIISPATSEELGYINLSMRTDLVTLYGKGKIKQ